MSSVSDETSISSVQFIVNFPKTEGPDLNNELLSTN